MGTSDGSIATGEDDAAREAGIWYGPDRLAEMLQRSSAYHAQAALGDYQRSDDRFVDAGLHCGIAVEHLAKAYLASLHPVLTVDGTDFDSLLVLTGHQALTTRTALNAKTISLAEACKRVRKILPTFAYSDGDFAVLSGVRNAAAHLALSGREEISRAARMMVRLVTPILDAIDSDTADYWGHYADLAQVLHGEAFAELDRVVEWKLANARVHFDRRLQENPALLAGGSLHYLPGAAEFEQVYGCPACRQLGVLSGAMEYHRNTDDPDTEMTLDSYAVPNSFYCLTCGLILEGVDEVRTAGFPDHVDRGTVFDWGQRWTPTAD